MDPNLYYPPLEPPAPGAKWGCDLRANPIGDWMDLISPCLMGCFIKFHQCPPVITIIYRWYINDYKCIFQGISTIPSHGWFIFLFYPQFCVKKKEPTAEVMAVRRMEIGTWTSKTRKSSDLGVRNDLAGIEIRRRSLAHEHTRLRHSQ